MALALLLAIPASLLASRALSLSAASRSGRPKPLAQLLRQQLVDGIEALPRVDHQQDKIRLFYGGSGLLRHGGVDTRFIASDTPGVDDHAGATANARFAVFAIACEAGKIRHNGIAAARELIKKRRFTDVGAPYQGYHRQHESVPRRDLVGHQFAAVAEYIERIAIAQHVRPGAVTVDLDPPDNFAVHL